MTNLLQIVLVIWAIEGGTNAVPPYGIKALLPEWRQATTEAARSNVTAKCKRWCENTVLLNWRRWQDAGGKGCYFDFLGDKYVDPIKDPVGTRDWKVNIKKRLRHGRCDCGGKEL